MKILTNLDLNKNEIQNLRIQNLAANPSTPVEGQIYQNTADHKLYLYNGSSWIDLTNTEKADKTNTVLSGYAKIISPTTKAAGSAVTDVFRVESSLQEELFAVKQNGDTIIGGKLTINGSGISTGAATDLTLSGNLTVKGNTYLGDDATQDTVTIKGLTTIKSKTTKAAGSSIVDAFRIESSTAEPLFQVRENGDTVIAGVLTVNGTGESTFAGDVSIGGKLTVAQSATASADLAGTDLTLTGNLVVQGNTYLGDNAVSDTTTIRGLTKIISKTTKALGSSTVDAFRVESSTEEPLFQIRENGDTVIAGVLTVNGTGESTFAGDVSIGGKLTVAESATASADLAGTDLTLTGNLVVHGNTTLGDDAAEDTVTIKGLTSIKSKTTKALGSSSVDVFRVESSTAEPLFQIRENGDTIIAGVLTVNGTGESTFAGDVSIGGKLTVAEDATVNAALAGTDLTLTGNLIVQGNSTLGNESTDTTVVTGILDLTGASIKFNAGTDRITATELSYLDGVTSSVQTQLNSKINSADAVSTNTANKVVKRDGNGDFAARYITAARVTGLTTPSADSDAVNKLYVDSMKMGFDYKDSVRVATTANIDLTTGGLLTIDTITVVAGDRVLVKNQTTKSQNGIYVAASGAWTRAADANSDTEVTSGMYVFVADGSVNKSTSWVLSTTDPITLGTTALDFIQFSGSGTYTAGNGLTLSGSQFKIVSHAGTAGSVGTVVAGSDGKLGVSLGTTSTTAAAGNHTHAIYMRKYAANIGDGSATSITVNHGLNTTDVSITVREAASPYNIVFCDMSIVDANNVKLVFAAAPTSSQYRIIVIG